MTVPTTRACYGCGTGLAPHQQRYCTLPCARRHKGQPVPPTYVHDCHQCGDTFTTKHRNKNYCNELCRRGAAKKRRGSRGIPRSLPAELRDAVYAKTGGNCHICDNHIQRTGAPVALSYTLDHLITNPAHLPAGISINSVENLAPAHQYCNQWRGGEVCLRQYTKAEAQAMFEDIVRRVHKNTLVAA